MREEAERSVGCCAELTTGIDWASETLDSRTMQKSQNAFVFITPSRARKRSGLQSSKYPFLFSYWFVRPTSGAGGRLIVLALGFGPNTHGPVYSTGCPYRRAPRW